MNRSHKKRSEVEDREEIDGDDPIANADPKNFWERDKEAPKRTPIRRKDRSRMDDEFEPKHKRDDKRKNKPLKYDW
jgi:hypothetical protein